MILYQMAKRLEKLNRLQHTIDLNAGDKLSLLTQKEQVEEQLLTQANVWTTDKLDAFMLDAVMPDMDGMPAGDSLY